MKKFLFALTALILAVVLCYAFVGCTNEGTDDDFLESDTGEKGAKSNNTGKQKDNTDPPLMVPFSSVAEIKAFLDSAKGSAAGYAAFMKGKNMGTSISQSRAQTMAANIEQNDMPLIKSDALVEGFGATYYVDGDRLDIIYGINNIRYRFICKYNQTTPSVRTAPPVLTGVNLGSYTLDLYQGDACLVGEVVTDSAVIQLIVYTGQVNDVALNLFDMGSLSGRAEK